ncbi:unnamed protein product [Soboliphyme baturini]|uniref:Annexin n=1 Tax=Soboliphyme baturini TaxID=241478 RepID=A0A183IVP7_9BILA|nr:unnamed protein product [Soboliphyme baturini]
MLIHVEAEKFDDRETNVDAAINDAKALYEAGEKRLGTNESVFNKIFGTRTHEQLQVVFQEYEKLAGHGIEFAVQKEFKGPMQNALLVMIYFDACVNAVLVKIVRNPIAYFAKQLYSAMKGPGTNDPVLIRIIVSRSERDLLQIKEEFFNLYGKSLRSYVIVSKFMISRK